jgi:hypothetical protein
VQHFCVDGVGSNIESRRHWTHICSFQTVKTKDNNNNNDDNLKIGTKNTNLEKYTVKLGYNDHSYNELTVMAINFMEFHGYNKQN